MRSRVKYPLNMRSYVWASVCMCACVSVCVCVCVYVHVRSCVVPYSSAHFDFIKWLDAFPAAVGADNSKFCGNLQTTDTI